MDNAGGNTHRTVCKDLFQNHSRTVDPYNKWRTQSLAPCLLRLPHVGTCPPETPGRDSVHSFKFQSNRHLTNCSIYEFCCVFFTLCFRHMKGELQGARWYVPVEPSQMYFSDECGQAGTAHSSQPRTVCAPPRRWGKKVLSREKSVCQQEHLKPGYTFPFRGSKIKYICIYTSEDKALL